jgi:hypothetical protein
MRSGIFERLIARWPASPREGAILATFVLVSFPATIVLATVLLASLFGAGAMTVTRVLVLGAALIGLLIISAAWARLLSPRALRS